MPWLPLFLAAGPFSEVSLSGVVSTVVYVLLGLALFIGAYYAIEKLVPFPVRKEIEEDQNIALGIIIGAMLLGLAIIIAAAILSPGAAPGTSALPTLSV